MSTENQDYLQQVKEAFYKSKAEQKQASPCPNCGYCPHCGRSDRHYTYPWYPGYPYQPYWWEGVWKLGTQTTGAVVNCTDGTFTITYGAND